MAKPDTETGWTKEYPSLAHGSWFWLRHAADAKPELHQLTGGRSWMESFGIVRDTTEFLGPVSPDDLEQLARLRKALPDLIGRFEREYRELTDGQYGTVEDFPEVRAIRTVLRGA